MKHVTLRESHIFVMLCCDLFNRLKATPLFFYIKNEGRKEMFYLKAHSTHFIYGYMASDIW